MQTENETKKVVFAVYLDNSSSLGMNYAFGNVIFLVDAQNDEYFRTRKIIFISDNWEICNELCVKISDLEQARFNRINGIETMWNMWNRE